MVSFNAPPTPEFAKKIIRYFVIAFTFLCLVSIIGMRLREAQQFFMMMGIIVIFGLLLRNVWLTLFLWWTVFLYAFFRFNGGHIYIANVFYGCVLFYLVKVAFEKKHINFFINAVLWLAVLNILFICVQILGYDFIYKTPLGNPNISPIAFMGNKGIVSILMVLAIPLLATRSPKSLWLSFSLFIPIFLCRGRINIIAGAIVLLFILFFKIRRIWWICLVVILLISAVGYFVLVHPPADERFNQWKLVLQDCMIYPVSGWGLDSYRNMTIKKPHIYAMNNPRIINGKPFYPWWDNPHNLYISLFFEWGVIGLIILGGYLRQSGIYFKNAVKEPNTLALAGFMLVVFIVSIAHFPMFLARCVVLIIPAASLFEIQCK